MSAEAEVYAIRVRGHLDRHWATWSGCTDLVHREDGTTTLRTGPCDQAQLYGILTRLRDMGVSLVAVEARRLKCNGAGPASSGSRPRGSSRSAY